MTYPCLCDGGVRYRTTSTATTEIVRACTTCNGTGQVADRRQSQRRKQGRRQGDDLLAEAVELLYQAWPWLPGCEDELAEQIKAFLEKINAS